VRRTALLASAAALCACSLIVNLGDLSSSSDAATDAPTNDAIAPDAGDFCGEGDAHIFCEDFDEDGGVWSTKLQPVTNGALLSVGRDDFVSPPASLRIDSDSSANAYLLATLPQPPPTDFACTLSVRVESIAPTAIVQTATISLYSTDPNVNDYSIFFQGNSSNGQLYEYEAMVDGAISGGPKALPYSIVDGSWHRVAIVVHLGAKTAAMTLDDGLTTTRTISPPPSITGASFTIGIDYAISQNGWTARFDDAFCDAL
jgi:hypothetical protein